MQAGLFTLAIEQEPTEGWADVRPGVPKHQEKGVVWLAENGKGLFLWDVVTGKMQRPLSH